MKKLFLSMILLALPLVVGAYEVKIDGIYYNLNTEEKTAEVTYQGLNSYSGFYYSDYSGSVVIPGNITYEGIEYSVTSVGEYAFRNCNELTSVTIPNSVSCIGNMSFSECRSLISLTIPNSVTTIGRGAFFGCSGITSVFVPNSITCLEYHTFDGCTSLTSVTIPNSVTTIGESVFQGCCSLYSVTIPSSVTAIGDYAFSGCSGLISVTIPNSVTSIGNYAFANCSSLISVTIPNSVTGFGNCVFRGCTGLTTVISELENPCSIEPYCFWGWGDHGNDVYNTAILYIPKGTIGKYKSTDYWNMFLHIVEGTPFEHILKYMVDGEAYSTYTIKEGDVISPEEAPKKEGYTFSGWSEIPETMPANDVTVTGTFTANKYKLTYMVDGEEYKASEVDYGTAITAEAVPTKEGYTFSGWSEIPSTMPAEDVTVTGTFTVNKYTITYMVDDAVLMTEEVAYGSTIAPPKSQKDGYDILWSFYPTTMPAYSITINGTYTTGISSLSVEEKDRQVFTPDGKRVDTPKKGLNIIRMSDGTVKKVVVK